MDGQKPLMSLFTAAWLSAAHDHTTHMLNVRVREEALYGAYMFDIARAEGSNMVVSSVYASPTYGHVKGRWEAAASQVQGYLDHAVEVRIGSLATKELGVEDVVQAARILLRM